MIVLKQYAPIPSKEELEKNKNCYPIEWPKKGLEGSRYEAYAQRIQAWQLVEEAFAVNFGITALEQAEIKKEKGGKPFSSRYPDFYFNISHCHSACACITSSQRCGIDVEYRFKWKEALAKKVCHPDEWEILKKLDHQEKELNLQILWSLKESFVKMNGRGLGYGMDKICLAGLLPFDVASEPLKQPYLELKETELSWMKWNIGQESVNFFVKVFDECTLAVCIG